MSVGRWVLTRGALIAVSAGLHAVVFVPSFAGHNPRAALAQTEVIELVEVPREDLVPTPPELPNELDKAPNAPLSAVPATHHHDYPVAPDHDAHPHDPALVHMPSTQAALAEAPAVVAQEPSPDNSKLPHFTIALGNAPQTSRVVANGAQGVGGAGEGAAAADPIIPEASVSVPARLVSMATANYPAGARAQEVEADVPVEIVLDDGGRVIEARVQRPAGFGFDDAALQAVRRYRFSPAQRNGQAVRVRMRWIVQFRLN